MMNRRQLLGAGAAGATLVSSKAWGQTMNMGLPEAAVMDSALTQSPTRPTIEAVEGDRVRIYVTNRLPEHTTVHWHGLILPSGMDGVGGLSHPGIPPGKTFVYEFDLTKSGTFMYHPHADEMVQMAMGMMGMFVVHPKDPTFMPVDRDFLIMLNAFDIDPGTYVPRVMTMNDFNLWTWNSRIFPDIDPLVVNKGDRLSLIHI